MSPRRLSALSLVLAGPALVACAVVAPVAETPPPVPVYSQASPYAPQAYAAPAYGAPGYGLAAEPAAAAPRADGYCAQAVEVAQDAAARAALTGSPRDAGRAARTAGFARRDC